MSTPSRADVRRANQSWEALMTTHATMTQRFAGEGMWSEVSMREYDVLYTLAKADEPLRLSELQSGVLLSQPALSRMVDRLVTRGLISRAEDPTDGRAVRISLTEAGTTIQREVGRAHAKSVTREVGGSLTDDELLELERLCRKMIA
ncbi:DNA-binding MarR family transcriptional regulator [Leucobacter exalbidus]|uniref:DNA-binding MarR family transcriptional regulator n=1 Tax=Leucobacter exalbidus TaxID=662960 RepID=A0A940T3G4_9MICO|nr:MarR family transcriptional regulator [Leucobacter exalbidus]MBP1326132.1 DNA-binding MarR family transcriptional regulator [Leucobacter exalbidus]